MDKRYYGSLYGLLLILEKARKRPFQQIEKWKFLQRMILKKVLYIEKRIQGLRLKTGALKRSLATPGKILSKAEASAHKRFIARQKDQIEDLQWLLTAFRTVADGIAFTFIDKYEIKPLVFKEKAGFIGGKKGLTLELKIFRECYKKGLVAILNDLTTVLRYNDITAIGNDQELTIEVKTSETRNARTDRQGEKAGQIFRYLDTGETTELYGMTGNFRRVAMKVPERNYRQKMKRIIKRSEATGIAYGAPEKGIIYMAISGDVELGEQLSAAIRRYSMERPLVHYLNRGKFQEEGYYPFSLSLTPEHYMNFLTGELGLIVMVDPKRIEAIARENGYKAIFASDEPWMLEFRSPGGEPQLQMSYHLFGRVFYEFISLSSVLQDGFSRVKDIQTSAQGGNTNPLDSLLKEERMEP